MSELLHLVREGPVATLTLSRPELHNAFNAALIAQITEALDVVARDADLRVLLLQGAGPSFCAGADIGWMRASLDYSYEENLADAERLDAMFAALSGLPLAVVGKIHGAALGGGAGLAACCDIVIAAEEALFGFTEVRLGLLPAVIARYVVPRIGPGHARALFVSGRRFGSDHARLIGLAHDVVPADQLDAAAAKTVDGLLRCGPQAIAAAKALVQAVVSLPDAQARQYVVEAIATARTGPEGQEGLRAFLEKRAPSWVMGDG
jgi:methylglutaconyl-CoA hydratase